MDDLKPNDSQMQYASSLGIDGTGMTRGEMSEAVKAAGGSPSAFEALGKMICRLQEHSLIMRILLVLMVRE
ncbi:hypothetical protein SD457_12480 [Coprobacillaceae bacterium CR2/5/TPMF4]|nr:hypothetical protein SD457_12480 [Coprobacillaceae bacterium CR2/5/TPMF4]